MKKNIFISVALIVLAVLAGCTPQSNYPAFPTSVSITQPGSFIKGQDFDASKFSVVVTYLDGSKQTINNAGLTYADTKSDGVSTDDRVTYFAGYDYQNNKVEQTVNISNVYAVDYITATTSKTSFTEGAADSQDFTVTAYFGGTNEVLGANNYTVSVAEAADAQDAEDYAEATSVKGVATVTLVEKLGGKETTVDVTVSKDVSVVTTDEVAEIAMAAKEKQTVKFEAFNYEELPAAEELGENLLFWVTYKDSEGEAEDAPATEPVKGADIEGITYRYTVGGVAFDPAYTSTDFTASAATGKDGSGIGLEATWNGEVVGTYNVPIAKTEIKLEKESGFGLVAGDDAADITGDSFRALLYIDNKFAEEIAITDEILQVKPGTGVLNAGDVVYISVSYNGLSSNELNPSVKAAETAKVQSITATTVEGLVGPAKQYYTAIADVKPVTDKNAVLASVTITTDQGAKTITSADTDEWGKVTIANAYSLSNTADKALAKGDDIMNASAIYLKVTYAATSCYVEIPFSTAVAKGVTLSADYGKVAYYDAPVDWTIQLTNDWGVVDNDYTGAYTAYAVEDSSSKKAELPAKLGEAGSYKVAVVLEDGTLVESTAVSLKAGTEWYELGNDFKVSYTGEKIYIDDKLSGVTKDKFKASGATYHGGADEATQPEVTAVTVVNGEPVEASNTVYATVTYKGQDLQDHTKTVPVTIEGTPYGEASTATLAWAKDNTDVTTLPEGTYNVSDFVVKGYKAHGDAPIVITVKPQNGSAITSGTFQAKNYESVTFSYSYLDKSGEMTEVKELKTITVTAAVEEA